MEILLYFEEGPGSGTIREIVNNTIQSSAKRLQVPLEYIDKVAIAYPEQFKKAISDLTGSDKYTENADFLAVGKAHTIFTDNLPHHNIVLEAYVFEMILQGLLKQGQDLVDWKPDFQMGLFIIGHELGHCKDHEIRGEKSVADLPHQGTFDLNMLHNYYLDVLVDESCASLCGDRFYTKKLMEHKTSEDKSSLNSSLVTLGSELSGYKPEHDNLSILASKAAGIIWAYLIQYSKIFVSKDGMEFAGERIPPLFDNVPGLEEVHATINPTLSALIRGYPDIPEGIQAQFIKGWEKIAGELRFIFEKKNSQWYFYWQKGL